MDWQQASLAVIRTHLEQQEDEEEIRKILEVLEQDSRAGAVRLAATYRKKQEREKLEAERLHKIFALRSRLMQEGAQMIAGVDEVGMGPLAGPVVAAAVILPVEVNLPKLNDSKKLSAKVREELAEKIRAQAVAVSIAEVPPSEIDEINIYQAGLEAMFRSVRDLSVAPDHVLVDARRIPKLTCPQTAIPKGDANDGSIAAASIVAKVHRDRIMEVLDREYPGYGFSQHMGYPTASHCQALKILGVTPVHRRSFGPVAEVIRDRNER